MNRGYVGYMLICEPCFDLYYAPPEKEPHDMLTRQWGTRRKREERWFLCTNCGRRWSLLTSGWEERPEITREWVEMYGDIDERLDVPTENG